MFAERLARLQAELRARNVHALALVPGPNLRYMSGLDFHLMERPTAGFFPAEGRPVFAVPSLESAKFDGGAPGYEVELLTYTDEQGPADAFRAASDALPEIHEIAVEHLRMRVAELRIVQRLFPNAIVRDADPIMDVLRLRKDAAELEKMQAAVDIAERALADVIRAVRPGDTERQIAGRLRAALSEHGSEALPFEPIVLGGPNAALPHGVPGDRAVQAGDVLLVDFGASSEGYISDITRTFAVGGPLEGRVLAAYEAVRAANLAGREAARPGATCQDVDRAARQAIEAAGFGPYFIHRTGHGIGLDGHERPYIVEGNEMVLEPGMTFTVEPGVYFPGEFGIRIEDDVVITEDGARSLTGFERGVVQVG
ncbi:MAG TPA: Xaa-Pro peptidase family protein [Aggregatilineales bacterium]|nr:Xaa-Pro peptidase family protein [Aggregatilineales bacterium]